eukprot:763073-Hanusia_phi.AAC.2
MASLPTSLEPWKIPVPEGINLWIKRDDKSGMGLRGGDAEGVGKKEKRKGMERKQKREWRQEEEE